MSARDFIYPPGTPPALAEALRAQDIAREEKRSSKADVRNPLLSLPAVAQIQALPLESQAALRALLKDISADARVRAEKCWRTHKAPMALYWKCVAVYTGHAARLLCRS